MIDSLLQSQVVFFGERHGDPVSHRTELALLKDMHRSSRKRLVLSLEMFETDVQDVLDGYLSGRVSESEFLAEARPWKNYSDYRSLIEYAKENAIRVVAANAPRRIASRVAQHGLAALDSLERVERRWVDHPSSCPRGEAWERFREAMRDHPGLSEEGLWRMYEAQCLKDATMARAIAQQFRTDAPPTTVLHLNGAMHSDYGHGVPWHLGRMAPELGLRVLALRDEPAPGDFILLPERSRSIP